MRKDIEINAEGTILRGWFYTPDRQSGKAPAIVMAHGFSAVKEMYLDRFAEHFCAAGLAARGGRPADAARPNLAGGARSMARPGAAGWSATGRSHANITNESDCPLDSR